MLSGATALPYFNFRKLAPWLLRRLRRLPSSGGEVERGFPVSLSQYNTRSDLLSNGRRGQLCAAACAGPGRGVVPLHLAFRHCPRVTGSPLYLCWRLSTAHSFCSRKPRHRRQDVILPFF
ncbi:hypothetical protein WMY93_012453 [Mugilogobius chulae]|uniref:Uncharacterized protein n=1 Tax=Mugilogobius chulae TaxID=88201 RepID=A0AAW0P527_9GOBI